VRTTPPGPRDDQLHLRLRIGHTTVPGRRAFIVGAAVGILSAPRRVGAQPAGKMPRVGYVSSNPWTVNVNAFEQGLRERGYTIGRDITVEYRFGDGNPDRSPALVDEMLRVGVDVMLAANPYVVRAAKLATRTVPIVAVDLETDPVQVGWVRSLSRPGGNLTGFFLDMPELSGKQLQLLSEAVPRLQRVAVLWDASLAGAQFKGAEEAARAARLEVQSLAMRQVAEFDGAFATARRQRAQALLLLSSPLVFVNLKRLADLALQHRLPASSVFPQFADAGGLMGYGPNLLDLYRRAAAYVDRILKGEQPGELPIQRPTVFDLALNLKAAKALNLTLPEALTVRANRIIQ